MARTPRAASTRWRPAASAALTGQADRITMTVALGQYEAELTAYEAQKTDYDELLLPAYEADLRAHKAEISRYEAQQHVRPRKKAPYTEYEMAVREGRSGDRGADRRRPWIWIWTTRTAHALQHWLRSK